MPTGEDEARSLAGSLSGFYQQPGESNHLKRGRRPFNPLTFPKPVARRASLSLPPQCASTNASVYSIPTDSLGDGIEWINRWLQGLIGSELGRTPNGLITLALLEHSSKFIHSGG